MIIDAVASIGEGGGGGGGADSAPDDTIQGVTPQWKSTIFCGWIYEEQWKTMSWKVETVEVVTMTKKKKKEN